MKRIPDWFKLTVCIVLVVSLGSLAGIANSGNISGWYAELNKPIFNPPNWLFGPVWTLLYALMGISLYRILQTAQSRTRSRALGVFWTQLILNLSWSFIFFHFRRPDLAFIDILLLIAAVVWMIRLFLSLDRTAGLIQLPYLLWILFAAVLNGSIWYLN
jgi:translocator protein